MNTPDVKSVAGDRDLLNDDVAFGDGDHRVRRRLIRTVEVECFDLEVRRVLMREQVDRRTVQVERGHVVVDVNDFSPRDRLIREQLGDARDVECLLVLHAVRDRTDCVG